MSSSKRIFVSVTNDLVTDQRVNKVCISLQNAGYDIHLIGRQKKSSQKLQQRSYPTKRLKLFFEKGPLFYLNYNISLFFYLLSKSPDIFLSNDLDTLPANFLAAKIKGKPLVYDSHEYFTEVPELVNRNTVKKIWEYLESWMLPKVDRAYTVSQSIAEAYEQKYDVKMNLIRNFPVLQEEENDSKQQQKIIIYQGAINIHRGIEQMVEAMQWVENAKLLIVGGGDIEDKIQRKVDELQLQSKVELLGRKPYQDLKEVTRKAMLGLSLEKKVGLNYTFALPNKVFDYIHAYVPVLASRLPEVERVFNKYEIGLIIDTHDPKEIAKKINEMIFSDKIPFWRGECKKASMEFNWQNEEKTLLSIFNSL